MTAASRQRFAEVVRATEIDLGLACLLVAAEEEPDVDVEGGLATLDRLAGRVEGVRVTGGTADRLRAVLGEFHTRRSDFADLRASLLPDVLARRHGLPILVSVVWLEVARRAGAPAYGIGLPGRFVVGLGDPDGYHEVLDPSRGGRRLRSGDVAALCGAAGMPFHPGLLRPWESVEILQRLLANVRAWAGPSMQRRRARLWAVELALLLPRHPAALRRERGELRVRGGEFLAGAADLEDYAAAVAGADPDAAEEARRAARASRARLN